MAVGLMIVDDLVEENMRHALKGVQDGSFTRRWSDEGARGPRELNRLMTECEALEIEEVGESVRRMSDA